MYEKTISFNEAIKLSVNLKVIIFSYFFLAPSSCQISFTNNFPSFNIQNKNGAKKITFAKSDFEEEDNLIDNISFINNIGNQEPNHHLGKNPK